MAALLIQARVPSSVVCGSDRPAALAASSSISCSLSFSFPLSFFLAAAFPSSSASSSAWATGCSATGSPPITRPLASVRVGVPTTPAVTVVTRARAGVDAEPPPPSPLPLLSLLELQVGVGGAFTGSMLIPSSKPSNTNAASAFTGSISWSSASLPRLFPLALALALALPRDLDLDRDRDLGLVLVLDWLGFGEEHCGGFLPFTANRTCSLRFPSFCESCNALCAFFASSGETYLV